MRMPSFMYGDYMKALPLSIVTSACLVALSACSNHSPSRYPEQVPPKPTVSQQSLESELKQKNAQLLEKQKEIDELKASEQKLQAELKVLTDTQVQLIEKEKELKQELTKLDGLQAEMAKKDKELKEKLSQIKQLTENNQSLAEQKATLEQQKNALAVQIARLSNEKMALEKELASTKPLIEKVKQEVEEKRQEQEKRQADERRVIANKAEIAKGFINKGVDNHNISYLSGAKLEVKDGLLVDQPLAQDAQNLNQLVVDGKMITLFSEKAINDRQAEYSNETHNLDMIDEQGFKGKVGALPKRKIGDDFAQMRFGYVTDENGKTILFVQGHQSPIDGNLISPFNYYYGGVEGQTETLRELPKSGRLEYNGYAFYGKDNKYNELGADALVDLDNRKVKVSLKDGERVRLTFGGVIDGNQFSGTHQGVVTKGAFYGTKGQDIGGIFYQTEGAEKDFNGVFGVTKRSCGFSDCPTSEQTLMGFDITP